MTSAVIRTLAGLALAIAASQAMAQPGLYGTEYRWLTRVGENAPSATGIEHRSQPRNGALEKVLGRAFVVIESDYRRFAPANIGESFRRVDPEFGWPSAFRRPRQARLSFSVRF